jgi:SAM-dependent methyltransferase
VLEVNKLFHRFEADRYDAMHPGIYQEQSALWQEMILAVTEDTHKKWRILNFGCGTGFEAQQLLQYMPENRISALTCYDLSHEMLALCRAKVTPLFPKALFCTSLNDAQIDESYNLLATNSVLHHISDVFSTISSLFPLLSPDAVWLAGHEPSCRFYRNDECVRNLNAFLEERNLSTFLEERDLINAFLEGRCFKQMFIRNSHIRTAQEATRTGLFQQQPSAEAIDRLVDFHVPHSELEVNSGCGFDVENMQRDFQDWCLTWLKTYNFMGLFYEGDLPERWRRLSQELAQRFPYDGANFCTVWQRMAPITK